MITSIKEHLIKIIENQIKEQYKNNVWNEKSFFFKVKTLEIDKRGKVGELFIADIMRELNYDVNYIDNSHGDYDLIVGGIKIEVKSATLDRNKKFQHEGIKANKNWDVVAFIDISPDDLYVTFLHKDDFTFDLKKTNKYGEETSYGNVILYEKVKNIHCRAQDNNNNKDATGAGYKVDFGINELKITKTIKDFENNFNEIQKHITKK